VSTANWETQSSTLLFEIQSRIRVELETVKLPDGALVSDYLQVRMGSFAVVYATTVEGKVVCIRQYKHGPRRVSLTLPAGHLEQGEDAVSAARRELLEETGFVGEKYTLAGSCAVNGNQGCGTAHLVFATMCQPVTAPVGGDLEAMTLELLTADEIRNALFSGQVSVLAHAAAIGMGLLATPGSVK
jgi:ADP-ribose pyrophosphatase